MNVDLRMKFMFHICKRTILQSHHLYIDDVFATITAILLDNIPAGPNMCLVVKMICRPKSGFLDNISSTQFANSRRCQWSPVINFRLSIMLYGSRFKSKRNISRGDCTTMSNSTVPLQIDISGVFQSGLYGSNVFFTSQ